MNGKEFITAIFVICFILFLLPAYLVGCALMASGAYWLGGIISLVVLIITCIMICLDNKFKK